MRHPALGKAEIKDYGYNQNWRAKDSKKNNSDQWHDHRRKIVAPVVAPFRRTLACRVLLSDNEVEMVFLLFSDRSLDRALGRRGWRDRCAHGRRTPGW